jgi:VCBS repeat-containing protein
MKLFKFRISRILLYSFLLLNYFTVVNAIAPVLSDPFGTDMTFTEGSVPITLAPSIFVSDIDGLSLTSYALVTIESGFNMDEDSLYSTSGTYNSETGKLTITGFTTAILYQAALRNVKYQNTNDFNPTTDMRTITFTIYDGVEISNTISRDVSIIAVNDNPRVVNPGPAMVDFTEGSAAVNILPLVEVTDDNLNLSQATITISNVTSDDLLSVSGIAISHSYNPLTGKLTISGSATVADYQYALRNVKYLNTNTNNPKIGQRGITYKVKDNILESADNTVTLNLIGVNDAPVLAGANGTITYTEGDAATVITSGITVTDADDTTLSNATVSISGYIIGEDILSVSVSSPLSASFASATGILTISGSGTIDNYQKALRNVTYRNLNDTTPNTSTRTINYQVYDGEALSNIVSQFINVIAVNDAPIAINDVYSGVNEGATLTVTTANGILKNDIDPDGPSSLIAQLITSALYGTLTLNTNGSFTYIHNGSENLVDGFTYRAFDSQAQSNIATVQITMTEVNDAPILSGTETLPLYFTEGNAPKTIKSDIAVSDSDDSDLSSAVIQITNGYLSTEDSLYYTSVGPTVSYNKTDGRITLTGSYPVLTYQNFLKSIKYKNFNQNNPSIAPRTVTFTVNDGKANSNSLTRQISILAVNDSCKATNAALHANNYYYVNDHLNITYSFSDPDGDSEGPTTFRWYTSPNANGIPMAMISGVTTDTFTVRIGDGGKYIGAIVRPIDSPGLIGITDTSAFHYMNAVPVFTDSTIQNVLHPNSFAVGEIISAHFTYFDKETNVAGTHEYQWYRSAIGQWSDAVPITSANTSSYTIKTADKNNFLALRVRPFATAGSSPGRYFRSDWNAVSELPSASFSGNDSISICYSGGDTLFVRLTSSHLPVSYVYQKNNSTPDTITVNSIASFSPIMVSDTGTYKLLSVFDHTYNYGIIINSIGKVNYYPKLSASLTPGSLDLCPGFTDTMKVNLKGTAPWKITYNRNTLPIDTLQDIFESKYKILVNASKPGIYTVSKVTDANGCSAVGTGQTIVTEKANPRASISGNDTICPYNTASLNVTLTGTAPFRFYYTINDGAEKQGSSNQEGTFILKKSDEGTYKITRVYDANNNKGCVSGMANVKHQIIPTATISGSYNECEGTSTTINVELTGTRNWEFTYKLNGANPVTKSGIGQSPYPLTLSEAGNYTISSVRDAHCYNTGTGTASLSIQPAPLVNISMTETTFTKDAGPVPIYTSPTGGSFSASSKPQSIVEIEGAKYFLPLLAGTKDSPHMIRYKYQNNENQCWGYDSIRVWVMADSSAILLDDVELNEKDTLCFNYDSLLLRGQYVGSTGNSFGYFTPSAAIENLDSNKAYLYPSKLSPGTSSVTVTFNYTVGGENKYKSRNFIFENIDADFTWNNDCFSGITAVYFADQSKIDAGKTIEHHKWKVNSKEYDAAKIAVNFASMSTYPIEYTVVSKNGCTDSKKKDLVFYPTYNPKEKDYMEDFSDGKSYWEAHTIVPGDTVNTWTLGKPTGTQTFDRYVPAGTKAWYTNVITNNEEEHSYVTSPCFNFWGAERPMIKMKIWRAFTDAPNIDGAVLQYSTDNGLNWKEIGQNDDGIYWYNNSKEIEGGPGDQDNGWTGQGTDRQDKLWVESRHALDMLIGKSRVKFRIAYGAPKYSFERDGFAFDDIWIGERSKKVLMEHFTNAGSEICKAADSILNQVADKHAIDVIDLQYHMDGPGIDTFNILNPFPSFSKSIYYDLPDVPYAVMNGGMNGSDLFDFNNNTPEENDIILSVLNDNKFYVRGNALYAGDVLSIGIDIEALEEVSQRPITVHVAIIENEIKGITSDNGQTVFKSVVRDLISSEPFNHNWVANTTKEHIDLDWDIVNIFNREELRIVTYLQDEITHEIYQASIDNPNVETGIKETFTKTGRNFFIYPNPTIGRTSIQWKNPLENNIRMEITDNLGRLVWQGTMSAGEQVNTISLEGLDAGTYTFRAILNNKSFESQKIILLSNN